MRGQPAHWAPMTHRGRGVNPKPPEPGVRGRILLQALRHRPNLAWPPSVLVQACGLPESTGYPALSRLLDLGLIEKWSSDTITRVRLTPHGRRFRL